MEKYKEYTKEQLIAMLVHANDTIDRLTQNTTPTSISHNGFCLFKVDDTCTAPAYKCLKCGQIQFNITNTTISYCRGAKSN